MTVDLAEPTTVGLRLMDIRLDGGTQTRAQLSEEAVERYVLVAKALPPVHVFYDGDAYWLADGFHRVEAWRRADIDYVTVVVHQGTNRDAVLYACGSNDHHGVQRTHADARRAVERLLMDEEWRAKSDRWIADQCKVSPTTVGRVRVELGAHADVREYERAGVTHHMDLAAKRERSEAPLSTVDSRNQGGDESTFQAPEPDNTVRTPVEHEHRGAPLTEEQRAAIVKLAKAGWGRAHIAEKFRIAPMEVAAVLAAAVEGLGEAPESTNGPISEDDEGDLTPSNDAEKPETDSSNASEAPRVLGPRERDTTLSQWWTPPELAQDMVAWAGIEAGQSVLEPSAGAGALVAAALAVGAVVEAHELDARWVEALRERFADAISTDQLDVVRGNYLDSAPVNEPYIFDWGLLNTPYEKGQDGRFMARALTECACVVALVRLNAVCGQERGEELWDQHGDRVAWMRYLAARPDFTEGEGDGAKSDFVVICFGAEHIPNNPFKWVLKKYGGRA